MFDQSRSEAGWVWVRVERRKYNFTADFSLFVRIKIKMTVGNYVEFEVPRLMRGPLELLIELSNAIYKSLKNISNRSAVSFTNCLGGIRHLASVKRADWNNFQMFSEEPVNYIS